MPHPRLVGIPASVYCDHLYRKDYAPNRYGDGDDDAAAVVVQMGHSYSWYIHPQVAGQACWVCSVRLLGAEWRQIVLVMGPGMLVAMRCNRRTVAAGVRGAGAAEVVQHQESAQWENPEVGFRRSVHLGHLASRYCQIMVMSRFLVAEKRVYRFVRRERLDAIVVGSWGMGSLSEMEVEMCRKKLEEASQIETGEERRKESVWWMLERVSFLVEVGRS